MKSWASDGALYHAPPGVRGVGAAQRDRVVEQAGDSDSESEWDLRASRFGCGDSCRRSSLIAAVQHFVGAEPEPYATYVTPSAERSPLRRLCLYLSFRHYSLVPVLSRASCVE